MKWTTKHKAIIAETIKEMEQQLNEFSKDRFVVATQLFHESNKWSAMIYYKVPDGE